jgi:monovalent cation:H+ antiporter, CPA1 family
VSGVVAWATAGLVFGEHGRVRVPTADWQAIGAIWGQLSFWASSLIFVLASMLVPRFLSTATLADLVLLPVLVAAALAARALVLWGLLPGLTALGLAERVGHGYRTVILWGGLRGAVTLALALAILQDPSVPAGVAHTVTVLATGFVLFTLVVQGTTLRPLIRRLGLDRLGPVDRVRRLRALELSLAEIVERLGSAAADYRIDAEIAGGVEADYRRRLNRIEEQLDEERHGTGDAQLAVGLATLANREGELYRAHLQEGLVAARIAGVLADQAVALLDGIKADGVEGYRRVARELTAIGDKVRRALWLHRRLRLERPLARVLADRFDELIVRGVVLRELRSFTRGRLRPLVGPGLAARLEGLIEARMGDNDRALAALELQFPDYGRQLGERYLRRAALRLEDEAYGRLYREYLIGPEVSRALHAELRGKRRQLRRAPALDLGLSAKELVRRVPLFRDLEDRRLEEIVRLMRPRLAVPGERLITKGERGDRMYVIASGAVEVQLPGGPVRLGTGEVFGEIALLTRRPRSADVDALGYCQLLGLDGRAFRAFLRADPELKAYIQDVARTRLGVRR